MINSNVKSHLARLLAKENIEIRHGEYKTAFFDVEKRVLGLPLWKDRGTDVYDLLVGHEVGHALYTPKEGWHESVVKLGVPRAFVNVIEDIRIEKKIQRTYPGLVGSFQRGYKQLVQENFFDTEGKDLEEYGILDRLNLKAKCGQLIPVEFSDDEMPIVSKAMDVETWDDVLEVCKLLMEYVETQENDDEDDQEGMFKVPVSGMDGDSESSGDDAGQDADQTGDEDSSEASGSDNSDQAQGSDEAESIPAADGQSEIEDEDLDTVQLGNEAGEPSQEFGENKYRVKTDEAYRSNEESLLEDLNNAPTYVRDLSKDQLDQMMISYAKLSAKRKEMDKFEEWYPTRTSRIKQDYDTFLLGTKNVVNVMAREFEMRKAAFQYSRGSIAKTGKIDPIRLHSYRYNEDIFNRVINLADAKSHGMVLFLDMSGSMHVNINHVVEQLIFLTQFCKKVNIPFVVYGFTSNSYENQSANPGYGAINTEHVRIIEFVSSKLSKRDYADAIYQLYLRAQMNNFYHYETMGSTPLNETLMAAHRIIPEFQRSHGVQKVATVLLTDGDASRFDFGWDRRDTESYANRVDRLGGYGVRVQVGRKVVLSKQAGGKTSMSTGLIESLKQQTGCTVIGFHIPGSNRDFWSFLYRRGVEYTKLNEYKRVFGRQKSIVINDLGGYDELYIIKGGKYLSTDEEEFEVKEEAKKGEITRAFKKFTSGKKQNRIVMTAFAKQVA